MRNIIRNAYSLLFTACLLVSATPETLAQKNFSPKISPGSSEKSKSSGNSRARTKKRRKRGCATYRSPRYRRMLQNWQKPPKIPKPKYRDGFRDLTLYAVNHGERIRVDHHCVVEDRVGLCQVKVGVIGQGQRSFPVRAGFIFNLNFDQNTQI